MKCGTRVRLARAVAAGCCGWMLAHAAQTQAEASLDLDLGGEHSDNVTRVASNEQSDTIGTLRAILGLEVLRPRLEARLATDLQYRHYFNDSYDSEILGGLSGIAQWSIIPENLVWVVENNYGQIANNRQAADTPDNREDFNYFSTGPDLTIPLSARTAVQLSGRWSDVYYEDSPQGSESIEGSAGLLRRLSERSTLSLNGSVREIEYDERELFSDFRIEEGYLRLDVSGGRTTLLIDGGYTRAQRDSDPAATDPPPTDPGQEPDDSTEGPLVRLRISRELTSRTTLELNAGSEFVDTAAAFRLDQAALGVGPDNRDAVAAGDIFRNNYAYLSLATQRERTTLGVSVYGRKERHETQTALDRDSRGATARWSRRLSSRIDVFVLGTYTDEEFVESDFAFREWSAAIGLGWRVTPLVSTRFGIERFDGTGDGTARDYVENRIYAGIRYSIGRRDR